MLTMEVDQRARRGADRDEAHAKEQASHRDEAGPIAGRNLLLLRVSEQR